MFKNSIGAMLLVLFITGHVFAVSPTQKEIAQSSQWFTDYFAASPVVSVPFSFVYDGKSSADFLKTWKAETRVRKLDEVKTERVATYTDPGTGLILTCRAIRYSDYPTVEWTLYFKNSGTADTPIIENIQALDAAFTCPVDGEFTLHYNKGDLCAADSFEPLTEILGPNITKQFAPGGGRPTNGQAPFWNIETQNSGFLVVLGWPGQWSAKFERDKASTLRICAGQELTRFTLHPNEEIRSPLVVMQFYQGDWFRAQNIWRRWMVAHNIPRPGGKLVPTHYGACWSNDLQPRAETELAIMNGFIREKIDLDFWFIDAGWYPDGGNWPYTGTWVIDTEQFPNGIRPVSDHARANGMQFVLWFEPERVAGGTWLTENHPEWILGGKDGGLVNLGNPEAWNWVLERFDSLIVSEGVDVYRQDFNIDPLGYWRGNDTPDRQGITEIGHVTGYLAYWDELLRRHPNLWIDTCASGGRRNDLETLRRSVPLLRSDAFGDPITQQCQTYGLSFWVPYFGSGLGASSTYWFRSCIFPASRVGWDTRNTELDYPLLHRMIAEFRKVQPYLLGDFYPLTPYSLQNNVWIAWQYDQPELDGGMIQAFRREECTEESIVLKLGGLDPKASYLLEDLDTGKTEKRTGQELIENGLQIVLKEIPAAALFTYQRIK